MKILVWVLVAVAVGVLAFGFSTCRREVSEGRIEITLFDWLWPTYVKLNRDRIAIFERENPDIKVKLITGFQDKYLTMVSGGVAPDVAYEGFDDIPYFAKRRAILSLDEYVAADTAKRKAIFALDEIADDDARRKAILALDETVAADAIRRKALSALEEATAAGKEFSCAEYFGAEDDAILALDKIADVNARRRAIFSLDKSIAAEAGKRKAISAMDEAIAAGRKFSCAEYFEAERYVSLDKFFPCATQSVLYRHQGEDRDKVYALPDTGSPIALIYNKKLFDEYNSDPKHPDKLDYPNKNWTWDDFRHAARELTQDRDGDGQTDVYGCSVGFSHHRFPIQVWQNGGNVVSADKKRCLMDSPEAIEAIQWLHDLIWVDKSAPSAFTQIEGAGTQARGRYFIKQHVAMTMDTRYAYTDLIKKAKFDWDVAPLPKGKVNGTSLYMCGVWMVSSQTHYPEQAWRLARFLVADKSSEMSMNCGRAIVANRATTERVLRHSGVVPHDYVWIDITYNSRAKDFDFRRELGRYYRKFQDEMARLTRPGHTPEKACRNATRYFNEGLDKFWKEEGGP